MPIQPVADLVRSALLGIGISLAAGPVVAQDYPSRPIRLIVPFAPGGGTDAIARSLSEQLGASLGATVIVENKPGAGSTIGTDTVARSAPDGHTLLLASTAHAINPALMPHLPYDTNTAFASVALVGKAPNIVVVRPDSPLRSMADVVKQAQAHPEKLTFGTSGNGTSVHLAAELFQQQAAIKLTHVPYRGAGPALVDLMGGQIDMLFATASAISGSVQRGQIKPLAITLPERSAAWKDVPTIAEAGYPDYASEVWYAIFAKAGTPQPIINTLNRAINEAVQSAQFKQRTEHEGLTSPALTPSELDDYVKSEQARWGKIIKETGIQGG